VRAIRSGAPEQKEHAHLSGQRAVALELEQIDGMMTDISPMKPEDRKS